MRVDHRLRARPDALGVNDEPRGDLAGELDHFGNGTDRNSLQAKYRHHADAPDRLRKSDAELLRDLEFVAFAERRRR